MRSHALQTMPDQVKHGAEDGKIIIDHMLQNVVQFATINPVWTLQASIF